MLSVILSAIFLSVGPPLITVGFGSSEQLLSYGFSFRHDGDRGGRGKSEKERKETGTKRVVIRPSEEEG